MSLSDRVGPGVGRAEPQLLRDDLVRQLEERLGEEQIKGRLPTLVAGIVRNGTIVWRGPGVDRERRRRLANDGHAVPDRFDHEDVRGCQRPAAARRGRSRPERRRGRTHLRACRTPSYGRPVALPHFRLARRDAGALVGAYARRPFPRACVLLAPAGRPTVATWSALPLFQPGLCRPGGTRRPRPFGTAWRCRPQRTAGAPGHAAYDPATGASVRPGPRRPPPRRPRHGRTRARCSGHGTGRPAVVDDRGPCPLV